VPLAEPSFTYTIEGQTVYFTNTTTGEQISDFSWDLGNGFLFTEDSLSSFTFAPGDYEVCLQATNISGTSESCETFTIEEPVGLQDYLEDIASINIFPNPVVNQQFELLIESKDYTEVYTSIYSSTGQLVVESKRVALLQGANRFTYELPQLSEGYYVLKINDETQSISRRLLLID